MSKRIFISFAMEDVRLRDFLVGQSKNESSPIDFTDMSVKKPWDSSWKTNCRSKIKGCHGIVALITKNSKTADGQLWEIKCAKEEGIPILGIWGYPDNHPTNLPSELTSITIKTWSWHTISEWIKSL